MKNHFSNFIRQKKLFQPDSDRLLLAVSGGMDSVVLCHLAAQLGLSFSIAHCNFQLRGADADGDETFVKQLALTLNVPFHGIRFQTKKYAAIHQISTQMAARNLRYAWFEKVRQQFGYQYIVTAHHANDNLETVLLNVTKGTGIRGLHGILPKSNYLVRPLLFASRLAIAHYQTKHQLAYREDASNQENDYQRNFIRNIVVPELKTINPSLENTFAQNIERWQGTEQFFDWAIAFWKKNVLQQEKDLIYLDLEGIKNCPAPSMLLYEILSDYGFNADQTQRLGDGLEKVGLQFFSPTHRLVVDRKKIILSELHTTQITDNEFFINDANDFLQHDILKKAILLITANKLIDLNNNEFTYISANKLIFPLRLRHWRAGDWFCPLGMKGKRQKIQDFFSNQKLSRPEKEQVWLLENGNQDLIWVVGMRLDERYRAK
jgi:tRNA(Ile)-lysidine synthase